MNLASNWKLTFDPLGTPLVILNYADEIDAELHLPVTRGLEVVPLIGSAVPFLRPSGNSVYAIQLKIFTAAGSDAAARAAMLDSLIAIDALGRKPLKLEISGVSTYYYQFANAFITVHDPGREVDGMPNWLSKAYTLTAAGLSKITP